VPKRISLFSSLLLFLVGCAPQAASPPEATSSPQAAQTASLNTAEPTAAPVQPLRYALSAPPSPVNIWSLFGAETSYETYLLESRKYPRLYTLLPQEESLTPRLAAGLPSAFRREGDFYTATLSLRPDLRWDEGSPLSAADVAFTVNTALEFQLAAAQGNPYFPPKLDHVEALDAQNLKYYFSSSPNAGEWQYGALLGFFANQAYWEPRIAAAKELLPEDRSAQLTEYREKLLAVENEEKNITVRLASLKANSAAYRAEENLLNQNRAEQEILRNEIETIERETRERFSAARAELFSLLAEGEPQFALAEPTIEILPREKALQALADDRIDLFLSPRALSAAEVAALSQDPDIRFLESRRNDIRFLAFNRQHSPLDDVELRRALACLIDPAALTASLAEGAVVPAFGWIPPENSGWDVGRIEPPCSGLDASARLAAGMRILQKAGYVWEQEPSPNHAGSGLILPSGADFPPLTILAPSEDASRVDAASYIADAAQQLGIPLQVEILPADELFFRVYGVREYDLAILGWRLSLYPDYLCRFFTGDNPYHLQNPALDEKCAAFLSTAEIAEARELLFQIEVLLWDDLPALPLFSSKMTEAYRRLLLPFENYWGGIGASPYGTWEILGEN